MKASDTIIASHYWTSFPCRGSNFSQTLVLHLNDFFKESDVNRMQTSWQKTKKRFYYLREKCALYFGIRFQNAYTDWSYSSPRMVQIMVHVLSAYEQKPPVTPYLIETPFDDLTKRADQDQTALVKELPDQGILLTGSSP